MKKFLITGGFLFSVLPAMALNLSPLYKTTAPDNTGGCSGSNFQSDSVSMQAIYVTDSCDAGYYLDVDNNAAIDSTTGIITGVSCQPCTDGHYCSGVSDITLGANNSLTSRGETDCPAGTYGNSTDRGTIPNDTNDPDYNTIIGKYAVCQACTGTTYSANTGSSSCTSVTTGWYADKVNSNDPGNTTQTQCPVGYRSIAAESQGDCTKTVNDSYCATHYPSSNFKHVATSGANAYTVVVNSNSIDENNQIAFKDRDFEPVCLVSFGCEPGYIKQNAYQWMARHPEAISATHSWCSPNGTGTDCSTQERGTSIWTAVGSNRPIDNMHFVSVCTTREINDQTPSSLVISQETAQFKNSDTGRYCWMRNVDLPDQPWFIARPYNNEAACAADCGHMHSSNDPTYMWGSMVDGEFVPADSRTVAVFTLLAAATEGNTNADYCFASEVTINWGKDSENQDITTTCTYGEGNEFTAPTTTPVSPAAGYKFIGWRISPANNNN